MISSRKPIEIGKYIINKAEFVGKGLHSFVYKCQDINNPELTLCAKIIQSKTELQNIELIKSIKHQNLLQVIDILQDENNYIIIQEFCEGGSLKKIIDKNQRLTQEELIDYVTQILQGYQELVKYDLHLRDLKPSQILFSKNTLKLSNFGFNKLYKSNDNEKRPYAAPEVYFSPKQDRLKDIYSLGLILYQLSLNKLPFQNRTNGDILKFLESLNKNSLNLEEIMFPLIKYLIQKMVLYSPEKRMKWDEVELKLVKRREREERENVGTAKPQQKRLTIS